MNAKQIQTLANELVDSMASWSVVEVATVGYRGALPDSVSADDEPPLRAAIQDTARCLVAGAVRPAHTA